MSISSYNQGQEDLKSAILNLQQKLTVIKDKDEQQDIRRFETTKNETHAIYKKYETIYALTGIATVIIVLFTSQVILSE